MAEFSKLLKANPQLWTSAWLWWALAFLVIELSAVYFHNGRTMTEHAKAIFGLGDPIPGVRMSFRPWLLAAILVVIGAHFWELLGKLFK
jgi:hypothetical protein